MTRQELTRGIYLAGENSCSYSPLYGGLEIGVGE